MDNIRIGIDINEANVVNRVGSNQYAFEILKALYKIDKKNHYTLYSSKSLIPGLPSQRANWQYKVIPPAKLWTQWRLPLQILKDKDSLDVFYSPGHYAPRYSAVPTVVTIMDLAYLLFPSFFKKKDTAQLKSWTNYSVKKAKKIIAISQNTMSDVSKYYKKSPSDIAIAYPGHHRSEGMSKSRRSPDLPEKYILYVGTIQPRKNLNRLIQAYEKLDTDHHLVIAGKKGWLYEETIKFINSSEKKDQILQIGYVPSEELPTLISGASCLVLPGLYEGFGIPPLEAIYQGTIPVVSNTGSLPEVVGENGITFDPYNTDSISLAIKNAIKLSKAEKIAHIKKLKTHTDKFSWESSAKKILEVLHEVAIQR